MKLKVCGLIKEDHVRYCVQNKVEFCGFILNYKKSHRYISFNKAKKLTTVKKNKTKFVGVLVKPTDNELKRFSNLNLDYFQIYGNFNYFDLAKIKEKFKKKIISVIQVKKETDINKYKKFEKISDIILWDSTGYEKSLSWNYNWLSSIKTKPKKMIAGNITIDKIESLKNIADIIDVSGALETKKVKDIKKIKTFIQVLRK